MPPPPSGASTAWCGGARLPWKSLIASTCTLSGPCTAGAGFGAELIGSWLQAAKPRAANFSWMSLLLAFSMMVKADIPRCGMAAVWHEYIAFVFTAQSMAIGLTTLVWLLVKDSTQE